MFESRTWQISDKNSDEQFMYNSKKIKTLCEIHQKSYLTAHHIPKKFVHFKNPLHINIRLHPLHKITSAYIFNFSTEFPPLPNGKTHILISFVIIPILKCCYRISGINFRWTFVNIYFVWIFRVDKSWELYIRKPEWVLRDFVLEILQE